MLLGGCGVRAFFGDFLKRAGRKIALLGNSSGVLGVAGAHGVCHTLCMTAIGALSLVGITLSGMPLMFLQGYAVYFWSLAFASLALSGYIHFGRGNGAPSDLMIANAGFVIAGIPFGEARPFSGALLAIGGFFVILAIALFLKGKIGGGSGKRKKQTS